MAKGKLPTDPPEYWFEAETLEARLRDLEAVGWPERFSEEAEEARREAAMDAWIQMVAATAQA